MSQIKNQKESTPRTTINKRPQGHLHRCDQHPPNRAMFNKKTYVTGSTQISAISNNLTAEQKLTFRRRSKARGLPTEVDLAARCLRLSPIKANQHKSACFDRNRLSARMRQERAENKPSTPRSTPWTLLSPAWTLSVRIRC